MLSNWLGCICSMLNGPAVASNSYACMSHLVRTMVPWSPVACKPPQSDSPRGAHVLLLGECKYAVCSAYRATIQRAATGAGTSTPGTGQAVAERGMEPGPGPPTSAGRPFPGDMGGDSWSTVFYGRRGKR